MAINLSGIWNIAIVQRGNVYPLKEWELSLFIIATQIYCIPPEVRGWIIGVGQVSTPGVCKPKVCAARIQTRTEYPCKSLWRHVQWKVWTNIGSSVTFVLENYFLRPKCYVSLHSLVWCFSRHSRSLRLLPLEIAGFVLFANDRQQHVRI